MLIKQIMTTEVETISRDRSLREAVETMLRNDVNHVIVREEGAPTAIVTRRKVLVACYKTDNALSDIPVAGFGRGFEGTLDPNRTLLFAAGQMKRAEIDSIPVLDDREVVGVLTKDDILDNVSNITDEALETEQQRDNWTAP